MASRETIAPALTEAQADALAGTRLGDDSYDRLVREDADLYGPDGEPLLIFRRGVIGAAVCRAAYPALRAAVKKTDNRGYATGLVKGGATAARNVGAKTRTRIRAIKRAGALSRTDRAGQVVESGIIGFYDRSSRFPYCRATAFNLDHPGRFAAALPFVRAVDAVFARELPERYAAQKAVVARTSPDFTVHGTAFTTITVNRNFPTAVHKDLGDLREGFGVITAMWSGVGIGCHLVFPRWRVAVAVRTGDVLLADVHQWHGNTPLMGSPGRFERISCVFYYRENMRFCGSAAEELELAKARRPGTALARATPTPAGPGPAGPAG